MDAEELISVMLSATRFIIPPFYPNCAALIIQPRKLLIAGAFTRMSPGVSRD
jgi:hypothetical protein